MANPEFANTEPLFLGKIQLGSFKPPVTTQYITLSVFLFKDALSHMYCWFINIDLAASSARTPV